MSCQFFLSFNNITLQVNSQSTMYKMYSGCEGDLVEVSVTPLIVSIDSADRAGSAGVPFLPRGSVWSLQKP